VDTVINCTHRYQKALNFAIRAHKDQKYGNLPYAQHILSASTVLTRFGICLADPTDGIYQHMGALLHDTVEDAGVKYREIATEFGERVAEIVYCVTDEIGRNRHERHEKTYPKIRQNKDAIIVKLADRITNAEFSASERSRQMDMYRTEYNDFRTALYNGEHDDMWNHLEAVLFPTGEKV